jgi:hypothetical protein
MMPVMRWVWPINAVYMGPIGLWAYWTIGLQSQHARSTGAPQPFWQIVFNATTHCGAGCTLGDIMAEWTIFLLGLHLLGRAYYQRKRAEGEARAEAIRCLKRRLADVIDRCLRRDADVDDGTAAPV